MKEIQNLEEPLKKLFGYNEFRPNQREIIAACLEGRDVLAILPTGSGKSICYQLPALLMPGLCVVISPLISLMQDQVVALTKNGLNAAFLNSSLPHEEMRFVMDHLEDYKLLYVAPERFANEEFIQLLRKVPISLFAIDEAHCISQWGHSFRPEYRKLSLLKESFPKTPIMALTATATDDVQTDIAAQLAIKNPFTVRASFDRPNLTFRIHPKDSSTNQWLPFLAKHSKESGILYCATRKGVDEAFELLQKKGFKAGKYHAGLSDAERMQAQHEFIYGKCLIMVATVAFGMGIHKPDIRFIIHLGMPRSIEQYYQEAGRAGRDGLPSECLMLYSYEELKIYELFLKQIPDTKVKAITAEKTETMRKLCTSSKCRRKNLLSYFGETYKPSHCDSCDRCLDDTEQVDATIPAQKILSCVYRLQQQYGMRHLIDVLRGMKTQTILEKGHDRLSTFHLMPEYSENELRSIVETLIEKGFLERTAGDYPILRWTDLSPKVTRGEMKVTIRKKIESTPKEKKQDKAEIDYEHPLFDELSRLRWKCAQETKVPAFVVFSDRTLFEMCQFYPQNREDFLELNGVSSAKWDKYGDLFLDAVLQYVSKNNNVKPIERPATKKKKKSTVQTAASQSSEETLRLFLLGFDPNAIAAERNLNPRTVYDHLCDQLLLGKDFDIASLVSLEKQETIKQAIALYGSEKLAPLKQHLPPNFTYEEIRLVASARQRTKKGQSTFDF